MEKIGSVAAIFWRIAIPYFRSEDRSKGLGLLAAVILLQLFQVWLNVKFNTWNNTFYNALQDKNWDVFIWQLGVFTILAAAFIVTAVYQLYLQQWLQIRWRAWMTDRYLKEWLGHGAHYRMRLLGNPADNPDQRIAEDINMFISSTLDLGIGLLGSVVTLVSFIVILWGLSAETPLVLFGASYNIPGYLVWAALVYSIIGTWVTHLVGRPLIKLNFDQQRYEADFRFALVRLRENAEEVTLLDGEKAEEERLKDRFGRVMGNWFSIMQRTKRLTFLTAGYNQVAIIFPFVIVSPLYFAGTMALGGLMQTASAFGQVQSALSFFVTAYSSLANWKAVLDRLSGFEDSIKKAQILGTAGPRLVTAGSASGLAVRDLSVALPGGREIVRVPRLDIGEGERVLLTGPSGSGKTSFFRSLDGAWPFGHGTITVPAGARVLVLPQRAYVPLGSLRGALAYPAVTEAFEHSTVATILGEVGLEHLVDRMDENGTWANKLSGGEQQRIGVARALLQEPNWLLLDEATSALDEPSEAMLYRLMETRLPNTAIVSIGHRTSLRAFHRRFMTLKPVGDGMHELVPATDLEGVA